MITSQVKSKQRVADYGEVFTAEREVNAMLNLVKDETESIESRFLEPSCGEGNFLAEILKRKLSVVQKKYNDPQMRHDYELWSMFAVTRIYGVELLADNIAICRERLFRIWDEAYTANCQEDAKDECRKFVRCVLKHNIVCGNFLSMKQANGDRITFAEWFVGDKNEYIHMSHPKSVFDICFDVIIGNPPYQQNIGANKSYIVPIYQHFVERSIELKPRYLSMIIPARWFAGGRRLDSFRKAMLNDNRLRVIHDFPDATDCFPGVQIKGGVCYFLWNRDETGDCEISTHLNGKVEGPLVRPLLEEGNATFIRYNQAISIIRKVLKNKYKSFSELVSPQTPFGIVTSYKGTANCINPTDVKMYISGNDRQYKGGTAFAPYEKITKGHEMISWHKVYISKAGSGSDTFPHSILGRPFYGKPGTICNQSYLVIGPFSSESECENVISYITTKFFRFMVLQLKNSQDAMRGVYQLVPIQDFSKSWTDAELYEKYALTDDEISFIESMIKPLN